MAELGMAGGLGAQLAEALDLVEHHVLIAGEVQLRVLQHRARPAEWMKRNEALRQEREYLSAAVSQLQRQYDDLHHVAANIYGKLMIRSKS